MNMLHVAPKTGNKCFGSYFLHSHAFFKYKVSKWKNDRPQNAINMQQAFFGLNEGFAFTSFFGGKPQRRLWFIKDFFKKSRHKIEISIIKVQRIG